MKNRVARIALLGSICGFVGLACSWDYRIWIPRSQDAQPLYRFTKGDKSGYIDQNGKVVIPPTFKMHGNGGYEFHDGWVDVTGYGGGEYVNESGQKLGINLDRGWQFSEGLAVARSTSDSKWGFIDATGAFVIPSQFETYPKGYVAPFRDGLAEITVGARVGFIDHSGRFVIAPTLLDAESFNDGFSRVVVEGPCAYAPSEQPCGLFNVRRVGVPPETRYDQTSDLPHCKFTFIDKSGKIISAKRYDYALSFSEGLAPVLVGKQWGYIDSSGELVIAPRYDRAEPFSDGVALVEDNDQYGFIDRRGFYVIPPQFRWAESFSQDRAVVGDVDGPVWYISHDGKPAISRRFAVGSSFFKGLAHVKLLAKKGQPDRFEYINLDGETVFAYTP